MSVSDVFEPALRWRAMDLTVQALEVLFPTN
jgi:hypothetical protein